MCVYCQNPDIKTYKAKNESHFIWFCLILHPRETVVSRAHVLVHPKYVFVEYMLSYIPQVYTWMCITQVYVLLGFDFINMEHTLHILYALLFLFI